MKHALAPILAALALAGPLHAVEYLAITTTSDGSDPNNHETSTTRAVSPQALLEFVSWTDQTDIFATIAGTNTEVLVTGGSSLHGAKTLTGISRIRIQGGFAGSEAGARLAVVKVTPAEQIDAVGPSSVLVLPENSTGNFDVTIETSTDLVTWSPFFSQTVDSDTSARFFRTRVTKTAEPAP